MKNVLLVSDSPVAGTVARFAKALNDDGRFVGMPFIMRGYKNGAFDLPLGAMGSFENWPEILGGYASVADAVVFHNVANAQLIDIVKAWARPSVPLAYHCHSPPFEPPLFSYDVMLHEALQHVFCVAQGHARFCMGATPMANIIADVCPVQGVKRRNAILVGHMRTTAARWSRKIPDNYIKELGTGLAGTATAVYGIDRLFGSEAVPHNTFVQALQGFDYIVDDVCSGMFHQISMEGLKSGCVVFSAADEVSLASFCAAADCPPPPFDFVSHPSEVAERARHYAARPAELRRRQQQNLAYARQHLGAARLGALFVQRLARTLGLDVPGAATQAAVAISGLVCV
ncbi:MAG: hypothetical protein QE285_03085 [Aquabacterium sp.]|nr:hypothetical protein [Aquabacterium sp.]